MPCDSIQRNKVDLAVSDPDLLRKALEAEGFTQIDVTQTTGAPYVRAYDGKARQWVFVQDGSMTVEAGKESRVDDVRRAYSGEVVKATAAKMGWQLKQTAPNKFQATRRAF